MADQVSRLLKSGELMLTQGRNSNVCNSRKLANAVAILEHESDDMTIGDICTISQSYFPCHGVQGISHMPEVQRDSLFHFGRILEQLELVRTTCDYSQQLEARIREQAKSIRQGCEEIVNRLVAAASVYDQGAGAHLKRIGTLSAAFAEAAGWSQDAIEHIRLAAPLHDIGIIGIPDAILAKPDKLTEDEYEIVKTHTLIGAIVLRNAETPVMRLAQQIARSHHEWWNGRGYPNGFAGTAIPASARLVAIVNVYDSLRHARVYRPALPETEVLKYLQKGRAEQFDPELLDLFFTALPKIRNAQENGKYE